MTITKKDTGSRIAEDRMQFNNCNIRELTGSLAEYCNRNELSNSYRTRLELLLHLMRELDQKLAYIESGICRSIPDIDSNLRQALTRIRTYNTNLIASLLLYIKSFSEQSCHRKIEYLASRGNIDKVEQLRKIEYGYKSKVELAIGSIESALISLDHIILRLW